MGINEMVCQQIQYPENLMAGQNISKFTNRAPQADLFQGFRLIAAALNWSEIGINRIVLNWVFHSKIRRLD